MLYDFENVGFSKNERTRSVSDGELTLSLVRTMSFESTTSSILLYLHEQAQALVASSEMQNEIANLLDEVLNPICSASMSGL